jgi:hypothetical protein
MLRSVKEIVTDHGVPGSPDRRGFLTPLIAWLDTNVPPIVARLRYPVIGYRKSWAMCLPLRTGRSVDVRIFFSTIDIGPSATWRQTRASGCRGARSLVSPIALGEPAEILYLTRSFTPLGIHLL